MPTIDDVRDFWNENPLLTGEIDCPVGTREWYEAFDELKRFIMRDDRLPLWIGDDLIRDKHVLDVGCGPGYWGRAMGTGPARYTGVDISDKSVALARQSADIFGLDCTYEVGNAEELDFPDNTFDHVVSEGVIHHTPDTCRAAREILRVLKPGGTATVSVYHKNALLMNPVLFGLCRAVMKGMNLAIKGRKRGTMYAIDSVDEFIRTYDGADNPIGRGYTRQEAAALFPEEFEILTSYLYFSPLRAFFRNRFDSLNRFIDGRLGLMIAFHLKKR